MTYGNIVLKKLYEKNFKRTNTKSGFPSFIPSVLLSFILIIIICTLITGILFYRILGIFITERTISSNKNLLNQYKNSVDSLLLKNINDISNKIMNDVHSNSYLYSYFSKPLENNTADIYEVSRYLTNMKLVNPLIYSLSIFYQGNNLLVSTDYIRHNLYNDPEKQIELKHYQEIIRNMENSNSENMGLVLDYGTNLYYKLPEYSGKKLPESVIHAVRLTYGYNRNISGAIIITVSSEIFSDLLSEVTPEGLGSILIVDKNGLIISHTDSNFVGNDVSKMGYYSDIILKDNKPGYYTLKVNGIPTVISYHSSIYSDWRYISVSPMEEVSLVARFIFKTVLYVSLISIVIGLLISLLATKKLAGPLKTIANTCRTIPYPINGMKGKNEYLLINNTLDSLLCAMKEKDKEINEIMPMFKMSFLNTLISPSPPSRNELNNRMKALGIKMPFKFFCILLVKIQGCVYEEDVIRFEYEKISLATQLEEIFTTGKSNCILCEKDYVITALLNYDFEEAELLNLGWRFLECTVGTMKISKYLAFGMSDTDILCMNSSFNLAINGLNYSYIFPEKHLYKSIEIKNWEESNSILSNMLVKNFTNSLKSLNQEKSIFDFKEILNALRNSDLNYQQAMSVLSVCVSTVQEFLITQCDENSINFNEDLKKIKNIFEFETWLVNTIKFAFAKKDKAGLGSNHELVRKAKEMIEQAIQGNQISLKYVARELGVSQKFLSRVFKNETNVKFVDYLTNLKLNYSRSMLVNSKLKVEEISSMMGYSTPQYFISRFKLMFGCTPGEYREEKYDASRKL